MTFAIDKGIPIPERRMTRKRLPRKHRFPYVDMRVGDSFLIPNDNNRFVVAGKPLTKHAVQEQVLQRALSHGIIVRTKELSTGLRVWRTE